MSMILRALAVLGACFLIASAWMGLQLVLQSTPTAGNPPVVEYKDFISILLTAIAVMIAVGAVVAAFAAIWGFELLRREIVKTTADIAEKVATARVDEIVPSLVEQTLNVDREMAGPKANEIAKEFAKEGDQ